MAEPAIVPKAFPIRVCAVFSKRFQQVPFTPPCQDVELPVPAPPSQPESVAADNPEPQNTPPNPSPDSETSGPEVPPEDAIFHQALSAFAPRLGMPKQMKLEQFQRGSRLKHLIFGGQLSLELLERFRNSADKIRQLSKSRKGCRALGELLSHKRAMLYFTQPSTRTFLSFTAACQILGLTCNEVRDRQTSSEVKRESPLDSIRMFSSYFDVIIMRSPVANFAECCAFLMNDLEYQSMRSVPIINGGSGSDEHPTQALLDVYTIQRTFQFAAAAGNSQDRFAALKTDYPHLTRGLDNKTYCFCGDMGRARTVRSLAIVLSQFQNVKMVFVTPEYDTLALDAELRSRLAAAKVPVREVHSLDATIDGQPLLSQVDCFYMTRIQREHNTSRESDCIEQLDLGPFQLTAERVARMRKYVPILHPFPRDSVINEIPLEIDQDPRAMYFRQARNGMWSRAALLVHLFDVSDELNTLYEEFYGIG